MFFYIPRNLLALLLIWMVIFVPARSSFAAEPVSTAITFITVAKRVADLFKARKAKIDTTGIDIELLREISKQVDLIGQELGKMKNEQADILVKLKSLPIEVITTAHEFSITGSGFLYAEELRAYDRATSAGQTSAAVEQLKAGSKKLVQPIETVRAQLLDRFTAASIIIVGEALQLEVDARTNAGENKHRIREALETYQRYFEMALAVLGELPTSDQGDVPDSKKGDLFSQWMALRASEHSLIYDLPRNFTCHLHMQAGRYFDTGCPGYFGTATPYIVHRVGLADITSNMVEVEESGVEEIISDLGYSISERIRQATKSVSQIGHSANYCAVLNRKRGNLFSANHGNKVIYADAVAFSLFSGPGAECADVCSIIASGRVPPNSQGGIYEDMRTIKSLGKCDAETTRVWNENYGAHLEHFLTTQADFFATLSARHVTKLALETIEKWQKIYE